MTPEQQLVQQITQILQSDQLERNGALEDLAMQFAEVCDAANARLATCSDFLDKGMRSEAVNEAHNSPDLLKLADLLQFDGIKKWKNVCIDLEMAVPKPLNATALERLRNAATCEKNLEPLLKEYRRCVFQGERRPCIDVLRKIRQQDPDNPSWKINLKPLEEAELDDLLARADEALLANDLAGLKRLYDELTHPYRVVEAPAGQMQRIARALMSERAAELKAKAGKIAAELRAAISGLDSVAAEKLLEDAAKVASNDAFLDKPSGWDNVLNEAKEMLDTLQRRKSKQADFLNAVDEFQAKLAKRDFTELSLRQDWERLQAWDFPVSDMLSRQVKELLDDMTASRRHKHRTFMAAFCVFLLALLAVACMLFWMSASKRKRSGRLVEMERLLQEEQLVELKFYLQNLQERDYDFYMSPAVQDIASTMEERSTALEKSQKQYDDAMEQLSSIRKRNYSGYASNDIEKILGDGKVAATALKDEVRIAKLANWRKGWEDWMRGRAQEASRTVKSVVTSTQAALNELRKSDDGDFDLEEAKLRELGEELQAAEQYSAFVDENTRNDFLTVKERLDARTRDLKERKDKSDKVGAEISSLTKDIPGAVTDLARYAKLLERYVAIAQDDDLMKANYRNALEQMGIYQSALALGGVGNISVDMEDATAKLLQERLEGNGALNGTVWSRDVQRILELRSAEKKLRYKIPTLVSSDRKMLNLLCIRYKTKEETEWHTLYMPNMLEKGNDQEAKDCKRYWGNVYWATSAEDTPSLTHTKDAFPNKFTTRNYDIEIQPKEKDNLCEYAKFLRNYISESRDAKNMANYILDGLQQLFKDDKMEAVPKALLIKRMLTLLDEVYGTLIPEISSALGTFSKIDTSVPWMNHRHPGVAKAEKDLKTAIAKSVSPALIRKRLDEMCSVLDRTLNVRLTCCGSCVKNARGEIAVDVRIASSREIWAISRKSKGAVPEFFVISQDGGENVIAAAEAICYPGMPVFAPAPGCEASSSLVKLGIDIRKVPVPSSWPKNMWK